MSMPDFPGIGIGPSGPNSLLRRRSFQDAHSGRTGSHAHRPLLGLPGRRSSVPDAWAGSALRMTLFGNSSHALRPDCGVAGLATAGESEIMSAAILPAGPSVI